VKFQDEYRDRGLVQGLAAAIADKARQLPEPVRLMEVCGTHTMAIAQFGLKSLLPEQVKLVSGPGCPVCVTPVSYIDHAIALSGLPDTVITTFGDLLRVPGSHSSLMVERAKGADIRIVYSALDAVKLATELSEKQVIFLGVGFETTTPTVAAAILAAEQQRCNNFSVLTSHKTMPGRCRPCLQILS
jgi:hydrogenase expression/formation protein HypD